jgi:hypothetical protein
MTKLKQIILWVTGAVLLVGLGAGITYFVTRPTSTLPSGISRQLSFSPFVVANGSKISVDHYLASKATNNLQTLTFQIMFASKHVTATEQVQPDQFTDVADYKSHFLSSAFTQYSTIQTASGVIYTGPASKLQNQQIGLMLERGLLVFFYPSSQLSDQDWRTIGDNLMIQNTDH